MHHRTPVSNRARLKTKVALTDAARATTAAHFLHLRDRSAVTATTCGAPTEQARAECHAPAALLEVLLSVDALVLGQLSGGVRRTRPLSTRALARSRLALVRSGRRRRRARSRRRGCFWCQHVYPRDCGRGG
jgi:hypothetical protein